MGLLCLVMVRTVLPVLLEGNNNMITLPFNTVHLRCDYN